MARKKRRADSAPTYWDMLKDPRWQRRRTEILQRDDWTCQVCRSTTRTLHVHHKFYLKNLAPWDYEEAALVTLCEQCHGTAGAIVDNLKQSLTRLHPVFVEQVRGYIDAIVSQMEVDRPLSANNGPYNQGVADYLHVSADMIADLTSYLDSQGKESYSCLLDMADTMVRDRSAESEDTTS